MEAKRPYRFVGTERVVVDKERLERALKTWAKFLAAKAGQAQQGKRTDAG